MLSKNKIKYIKSLEKKKFRDEYGVFLAEGNKLVADLLGHFECELLVAKPQWMATQGDLHTEELVVADEQDIRSASLLKSPQDVLAVFRQPVYEPDREALKGKLSLALDGVQDPGNMGTIIRLADWFGIGEVFCSHQCADVYNPKTVQATMGALARVRVHYTDLVPFLKTLDMPLYGTVLDGNNLYGEKLDGKGMIVMGNEGNGISAEVDALLTHRLYIPNFPPDSVTSESLNVAVATAVVCAEFRRREIEFPKK
ncbi:MAG: RNA methyltransferase [Bacteroidales bacterium]|nr:RNA methyltransferase [Bacteroidales bacterium]